MTIERAFRVAHNLDVPAGKRRYWPPWAVVVVRDLDDVPDVMSILSKSPKEEDQLRCLKSYLGVFRSLYGPVSRSHRSKNSRAE